MARSAALPAIALAGLLLLAAAPGARADWTEDLLRALGLPGGAILGAPGQVLGVAGDAAGATVAAVGRSVGGVGGAALGFVEGAAALAARSVLAGAVRGEAAGQPCGKTVAVAQLRDQGATAALELVLAPGADAPLGCGLVAADWDGGELRGSAAEGWHGAKAENGQALLVWLGPAGPDGSVALRYEAWRGGALERTAEGTITQLA